MLSLRVKFYLVVILLLSICEPSFSRPRSVYLNGHDISSALDQKLENIDVFVDSNGDIFLTAPQYEVVEENSFLPLSEYLSKPSAPKHQQAAIVGPGVSTSADASQENSEKLVTSPMSKLPSLPTKDKKK